VVGFTAPVFPVEEGNGTAIVCISTDSALVEEVSVEVIASEIASENASGVLVCVRVWVGGGGGGGGGGGRGGEGGGGVGGGGGGGGGRGGEGGR